MASRPDLTKADIKEVGSLRFVGCGCMVGSSHEGFASPRTKPSRDEPSSLAWLRRNLTGHMLLTDGLKAEWLQRMQFGREQATPTPSKLLIGFQNGRTVSVTPCQQSCG